MTSPSPWRKLAACAILLLLSSATLLAASDPAAHQRLMNTARRSGDYPAALYHTAWLTWLAPRKYADQAEDLLRDRKLLDYCRRAPDGITAIILAAVDARRAHLELCLSGRVKSQAPVRQERIAALLKQAEAAQTQLAAPDPVARMALADLCLSLDDVLSLRAAPPAKDRRQVLRKAVSAAEAVAATLPDTPGPYRALTLARARLAELDNDPAAWDLAITACAHALASDPDDQSLCEIMWGLHLRAGHWEEAKRWERRVKEK